jgi:hypothetical protein
VKDALLNFVSRVRTLHGDVDDNEAATKAGLIGPLFTVLGYDLSDPAECKPEFKAEWGNHRALRPADWVFSLNGRPAFVVEAKAAGESLGGSFEQLREYFGKLQPDAKLGILTNGVKWHFFTDVTLDNVMDVEPFATWDVLNDEEPPYELLTLLQKSHPFNAELIQTFAKKKRAHSLLIKELTRLLEPTPEFIKLAIENIETRNATPKVLEAWKPVVAGAIEEWARQRTLSSVLSKSPAHESNSPAEPEGGDDHPGRYALRKRFWEGLFSRCKAKNTRHANLTPSEFGWAGAGSGVRGLPYTYTIRQEEVEAALFIERGVGMKAENKEIFDRIHKHKDEIERAFGGELSWQRLDDKQGCRIAYVLEIGGYRSDESKWPGIQDAMIDAMARLEKALAPHLTELKGPTGL